MADSIEELQKQFEELAAKYRAAFPDKELTVFKKGVNSAADVVDRITDDLKKYRTGIVESTGNTREKTAQERRFQSELSKSIENIKKSNATAGEQQKALEELNKRIEETADTPAVREALKKQVERTTQVVAIQKSYADSLEKTRKMLGPVATAAGSVLNAYQSGSGQIGIASSLLQQSYSLSGQAASSLGSGLQAAGGSAIAAGGKVGKLGILAVGAGLAVDLFGKGLSGVASKVIPFLTTELNNYISSFQAASSTGAVFGDGLNTLMQSAKSANLDINQFSSVLKQNAGSLADSGLGVGEASKRIGGVLESGGKLLRDKLSRLGFTYEEQAGLVAETMSLMRQSGSALTRNDPKVAAETEKYANNLRTIANITGEDAKGRIAAAQKKATELAFQQKLDELEPKQKADAIQAMSLLSDKEQQAYMEMLVNDGRPLTAATGILLANSQTLNSALSEMVDKTNKNALTFDETKSILGKAQKGIEQDALAARAAGLASMAGVQGAAGDLGKGIGEVLQANKKRTAEAFEKDAEEQEEIRKKAAEAERKRLAGEAPDPKDLTGSMIGVMESNQQLKILAQETILTSGVMKTFADQLTTVTNTMIELVKKLQNENDPNRSTTDKIKDTLADGWEWVTDNLGTVLLTAAPLLYKPIAAGVSALGTMAAEILGAGAIVAESGAALSTGAAATEAALTAGALAVEGAAAISAGSMAAGAALIAAPVVAGVALYKGLEVVSEKIAADPNFAKIQERDTGKTDAQMRQETVDRFAQRNNPDQDKILSRAEIIKKYGLTGQQAVAQAMPGEDTWTLKDKSKLNTKTGERFDEQGNLLEIRGGPELTDALKELLKTNVDLKSTYLKLNDEGRSAAVEASKSGLDAASGFLEEQKRMAAEASKSAAASAAVPVKATMTPTIDTTALEQGLKAQYTDANAAMTEMQAKQAAFIAQNGAPDVTLKPTMADFASDTVRKGYSDPELQKQAEEIQKSIYQFNSDQREIQVQLRNVIAGLPAEFNKNNEFGTGRGGLKQDEAAVQALIDKFGFTKEQLKQVGGGPNANNSLKIGEDSYSLQVVGLYKKLVDEDLKKKVDEGKAAKAQVAEPEKQGSAIPVDVLKQLAATEKPEEDVAESSFSPDELYKALLDSSGNYLAGIQSPRQMRDALPPEDRPVAVKAMPSAQGTSIPPEVLQKLGYDKDETSAELLETITPIRDFANNIKGYMGVDGQKVMLDKLTEVVAVAKPNKEEPKVEPPQVGARAEATISPEKLALEQAAKSQFADAQSTRKELEAKQAALIAEHGKGDIKLPATALDYATETRRTAYSDPEVQKQSEALKAAIDQYSKDQLNAQLALANIIAGLPAEFNKGTLFATGDFENSSVQMQGAIKALIDEFGYTKEELKKFAGGARGGNRIQVGDDVYNPQVIGLYRKKVEEELKKSTTEQAAKIVTPESQMKDLVAPIIDMNRNADQTKSDQKAMLDKMDDVAAVATPTSASADAIQRSMADISNSIKVAPNEPTMIMPDPLQMQKSTIEGLTEASTQRTAEQVEQQTKLLTAAAEMRNTMIEVSNPDKPDMSAVLANQMGKMVSLLEDLNDNMRNVSTNTRNTFQAVS